MRYLKNFVKPITVLLVGIFLLSFVKNINFMSLMNKMQNNLQEGLRVVKVTDEKSQIKDENLTIKFRVPRIHYENEKVEKNINSYIEKNIREYINVQRQIANMSRKKQKQEINISYSVIYEDKNIINLIINKNIAWGEKNFKLEKDSYIFNLKTGNRIYLDEFLKGNTDYSEVISENIRSKMDKKHPLYDNLNIDKNTNYYIEDRYINIYFNPYKQSQDDTQYEFKIPYDIFKNKIEVINGFYSSLINKEILNNNNKYLKSTLEIPVVNSGNKDIDSKINQQIRKDINTFYEKSYKEAETYLDDFELDNSNFIANTSFSIKKNTCNILSIVIEYYKYNGGTHGYYEYIAYNFRLKNGKNLTLEDIFKKDVDYKTLINEIINKQIKEINEKDKELQGIYKFYGIKDKQKFYLEDNKIVIFFDLYDIAPYAAGVPKFPIYINEIEKYIKNEYKFIFN